MLRISSVLGNRQRLDGGAMFGNAPRAFWERFYSPDEVGRIELACRAFLVEMPERTLLIETGIGCFFSPELRARYGVFESNHVLLESLAALGRRPDEIDVVFLSHLHFDHAGGLLTQYVEGVEPELVFPRAKVVTSRTAYERATRPHLRDQASFPSSLVRALKRSKRLELVEDDRDTHPLLGKQVRLLSSQGHSPGMRLPLLEGTSASAVFCADLIPGAAWVHLPLSMGYDRAPELLIDEKAAFYRTEFAQAWLLFTHDPVLAAARLEQGASGRYEARGGVPDFVGWDLDETPFP